MEKYNHGSLSPKTERNRGKLLGKLPFWGLFQILGIHFIVTVVFSGSLSVHQMQLPLDSS